MKRFFFAKSLPIKKLVNFSTGFSFMEIMMALAILALSIIPILNLFSSSGRSLQKSQNLGAFVGIAHKISQHLLEKPYEEILSTGMIDPCSGVQDDMFNPLENFGSTPSTIRNLTREGIPQLHNFLKKNQVRYSLDVVGDCPKDVKICLFWVENGKNLLYPLRMYVAKH